MTEGSGGWWAQRKARKQAEAAVARKAREDELQIKQAEFRAKIERWQQREPEDGRVTLRGIYSNDQARAITATTLAYARVFEFAPGAASAGSLLMTQLVLEAYQPLLETLASNGDAKLMRAIPEPANLVRLVAVGVAYSYEFDDIDGSPHALASFGFSPRAFRERETALAMICLAMGYTAVTQRPTPSALMYAMSAIVGLEEKRNPALRTLDAPYSGCLGPVMAGAYLRHLNRWSEISRIPFIDRSS